MYHRHASCHEWLQVKIGSLDAVTHRIQAAEEAAADDVLPPPPTTMYTDKVTLGQERMSLGWLGACGR